MQLAAAEAHRQGCDAAERHWALAPSAAHPSSTNPCISSASILCAIHGRALNCAACASQRTRYPCRHQHWALGMCWGLACSLTSTAHSPAPLLTTCPSGARDCSRTYAMPARPLPQHAFSHGFRPVLRGPNAARGAGLCASAGGVPCTGPRFSSAEAIRARMPSLCSPMRWPTTPNALPRCQECGASVIGSHITRADIRSGRASM